MEDLSPRAEAVLADLVQRGAHLADVDAKTPDIAATVGVERRTVQRALAELVHRGYVQVRSSGRAGRRGTWNSYRISGGVPGA